MSHLNDQFSKIFHEPLKCDRCIYFFAIFQVLTHSDTTKKWVWSFYMLLYDNYSGKALPSTHFLYNYHFQNVSRK